MNLLNKSFSIKFFGLLSILIILSIVFYSCFSSWNDGNEGIIKINLYNNSRTLVPYPPDDPDVLKNIEFKISIYNNINIINLDAKGLEKVSVNVPVGFYNIKVDAYLENVKTNLSPNGERFHYASGMDTVDVKAGQNNSVTVQMYKEFCDGCGEWEITLATCEAAGSEILNCSKDPSHNKNIQKPAPGHDHLSSLICKRDGCDHQYAIGETGPAGGIIFYVADGQGGRSLGFTVQGSPTGYTPAWSNYTAYYLEAAPSNISEMQMWSSGDPIYDRIPGLSQDQTDEIDWAIGRGRMNTAIIIARGIDQSYITPAASACVALTTGDKVDWFLPSKNELNELRQNRGQPGIPSTGAFWSSSQASQFDAWGQFFTTSNDQGAYSKGDAEYIRPIRAF